MGDYVQQFYIRPRLQNFVYIVVFSILFFCLGILGSQIQSAQHGIYLFWPASGLTFAAFFIFGYWLWPGVFIGFALLAFYFEIPLSLSLAVAIISILESAIFLTIAQKFNFKGHLATFKDCLVFSMLALVAPMFAAIFGSLIFYLFSSEPSIPPINMILLWWLGNSLGILLLGGTILSFYNARQKLQLKYRLNEKIAMLLGIVFVFVLAFSQNEALDAALIVNFIIPIIYVAALRFGACGATLLGLVFIILISLFCGYSQNILQERNHFDIQYLILVKIWFICISGVLIAGAFNDSVEQGRLEWQALHDGLTGLFNRIAMEEEIEQSLNGVRTSDNEVCLLFLDVDNFKPVNDQLGHIKGDEVLKKVAGVLKSTIRNIDVVSRWGGDEFVILLHQCNEEQALIISNKILTGVKALSFAENQHDYPLSMSIGVASIILGESRISFIERADAASYEAKNNGKNQVVLS